MMFDELLNDDFTRQEIINRNVGFMIPGLAELRKGNKSKMNSIEIDCTNCKYSKYPCPLWQADLTKDGELIHSYEFKCPLEEKENGNCG